MTGLYPYLALPLNDRVIPSSFPIIDQHIYFDLTKFYLLPFLPDEEGPSGRRDLNNSVFEVIFPCSVNNLDVETDESFVFDDLINEPSEEGFVFVLEVVSGKVTLREGRDVLIIRIGDNDGM